MDYNSWIKFLRDKYQKTALEKDILDTADELFKNPFDMDTAKKQVLKNNSIHPDICAAIAALPTTERYPNRAPTEEDLGYNLYYQLDFLIMKEVEALNRGK